MAKKVDFYAIKLLKTYLYFFPNKNLEKTITKTILSLRVQT